MFGDFIAECKMHKQLANNQDVVTESPMKTETAAPRIAIAA